MLDGYTTIAFFGVDNRSNGNFDSGNSDTIMLCNINNYTKQVELVSVYRDTLMDVDGERPSANVIMLSIMAALTVLLPC